ncbi:MAG: DNA mismatch repair endonuclease MutL, partial [Lachnospiraceae bacterium]|nr:DNA mismatch repair endonuclease MutL [Lachnospiraceae bacterium]
MAEIIQLDKNTIDQIAAGEVIENPASVVKELVENAIDAGSTLITVEIREGGTSLIRVTDNGSGIEKTQVRKAFFSHATSKIRSAADLFAISSLGFRGEALSSIAAVAEVEMITKPKDALIGVRYLMDGSKEEGMEEVGAPSGTSVMVRRLFYNTPARKKFLRKPRSEGALVGDLMEKLALDNPHIAFHLVSDKKEVFSSSGSGNLKELIYRIYGREIANSLIPVHVKGDGVMLHGFLGEPVVNRANRNQELFFVNGRYVRNKLLSRALEEGYQQYLMQHRFPFAVLFIELSTDLVDVNAHPSKMEVRFHEPDALYEFIRRSVEEVSRIHEMIPNVALEEEKKDKINPLLNPVPYPQPFEVNRLEEPPSLFEGFSQKELLPEDETGKEARQKEGAGKALLQKEETGQEILQREETK